ncbi:MAG: DUF4163 domain-containing protein [Fimbriimonadales bacterium]|nr:DUF4163 domain-containing protein [Fimbriimonadales bacterium]
MRLLTLWLGLALLLAAACSQPLKVSYRTETQREGDFYKVDITLPVFPADSPVGALANQRVATIVNGFKTNFLRTVRDNKKIGFRTGAPFELRVRPTVSIARANLVSLYLEVFLWTGGAHPNTFYRVVNVGTVNGKPRELTLKDVFRSAADREATLQQVYSRLEDIKRKRVEEPYLQMPEGGIPREYWDSFVLTPSAIVWIFEPYAVGAYVEGKYMVRLAYAELEGRVNAAILQAIKRR